MVSLTVTHADGSTDTIPETTSWTRTFEIGNMRRARFSVERSLAEAANLDPKSDAIEVGNGIDTLRLVEIENGTETWTLTAYSFEWDANNVAPTLGGDLREGDDNALITGLIGEVQSWSAGTIGDFTGPLSFVFNHAQRHEALRRIERNVPGEIQFRDGGTVDYLSRLGSDKSGSVELSNTAGTIEEEINITKHGRELDGTHIRVLGAHEGEAQLFANLVPADDSATYENRVDYTTSRWSDGDARDWDRWENKDVTDQATIEEEAAALGEELKEELIEAKATTPELGVQVGDTVQVVKADADLDRPMRIHRLKELYKGATKKLKLLLSTRTTLRTDDSADLRDIQRFNTGFQGSSVAVNGGPVISAVDSANPLTFGFRYPDLEFENTATLRVRGEPYRVDSQPKTHDHDVDLDIPNHDHTVDILATSDGGAGDAAYRGPTNQAFFGPTTERFFLDIPDFGGNDPAYAVAFVNAYRADDTGYAELEIDMFEKYGQSDTIYNGPSFAYDPGESRTLQSAVANPQAGTDQWVFRFDATGDSSTFSVQYGLWAISKHTHGIDKTETSNGGGAFFTTETSTTAVGQEPGIFTTADTPTNVGVDINGTTVATGIGTGTFETTVDIGGDLTNDSWNDITLTSDSLGRLQATVFIEGYDKVGLR